MSKDKQISLGSQGTSGIVTTKVKDMGNVYLYGTAMLTVVASLTVLFGNILFMPSLLVLLPSLYLHQNFREFRKELKKNGVIRGQGISSIGLLSLFVKTKLKIPMDVSIGDNDGKHLVGSHGQLQISDTQHSQEAIGDNNPIASHKTALTSWKNVMASCDKTFELSNLKQEHLEILDKAKRDNRKLIDAEYSGIIKYCSNRFSKSHDEKTMELMKQFKEITSKISSLSSRLNEHEDHFFMADRYSSRYDYGWDENDENLRYRNYESGKNRILDQQYSRIGEALSVGNKLKELHNDPSLFKQDTLGPIFDEV